VCKLDETTVRKYLATEISYKERSVDQHTITQLPRDKTLNAHIFPKCSFIYNYREFAHSLTTSVSILFFPADGDDMTGPPRLSGHHCGRRQTETNLTAHTNVSGASHQANRRPQITRNYEITARNASPFFSDHSIAA
jgi:hypothetical protein